MNALKLVTSLISMISDVKLRRLLKQAVALLVEELHKQPATANGIDQQSLIDENNLLRQQVEEMAGHKARQVQLFNENTVFKKALEDKDQQIADLTKSAEEVDASNRLDVDRLMKALNSSTEKLAMLQQSYDDVSKAHASMMETEAELRKRLRQTCTLPKTDIQVRSWALERIAEACLGLGGKQVVYDMSSEDVNLLVGKSPCSHLDGRASDACCSASLPFLRMVAQHYDLSETLLARLQATDRGRAHELKKLMDRRFQ